MAVVKNLMVRAGADFSAITKQAKKVNQSLSGMQATFDKVGASLKKAFSIAGLAAAGKAIYDAGKAAKESYDQQAEAQAKLAQVMRNTMGASGKEVAEIQALADAQQKLGVISADTQIAAAQELATYLQMPGSLKTLLPVLNDMVAQQYGLKASAEQATTIATMLGKVMEGQTGALSRYGYSFTEAQEAVLKYGDEAERAAVLSDVVSQSVGGMNAALASTPSGRLRKVSNTLDDIKAQFGQAFTIGSTAFIPMLNSVASTLATLANLANRVAVAFANVFGGKVTTQAVDYAAAAAGAGSAGAAGMDKLAAATKKAGSAAKEALSTASFDTLHILADKSKSGGGGGSDDDTDTGGIDIGGGGGGMIVGGEETIESVGWLEGALTKLRDFATGLDFGPLQESFGRLKDSAKGLAETLGKGLSWAFDNVLAPLASWTVSDLLPASLDVLSSAVDVLTAALEALAPAGEWLWENFLQPIAEWTGDTIISALGEISDLLSDLADLISGDLSLGDFIAQLDPLQSGLLSVAAALGAVEIAGLGIVGIGALDKLPALTGGLGKLAEVFALVSGGAGTLHEAMDAVFGKKSILAGVGLLIGGASLAFTKFVSLLKNGFNLIDEALMVLGIALAAIGAIILGAPANVALVVAGIVALVAGLVIAIKENWSGITAWFQRLWDSVKQIFVGFLQFFSGIFTLDIVKTITGLLNIISGAINLIILSIQAMVNFVISCINSVLDFANTVGSVFGATWNLHIGTVSLPTIPRLATGAVIPPNNEFMAILGDQTQGMNIETPEELLRQIVREENDSSRILDAMDDILDAIREGKVIAVDHRVLGRTMRESQASDARSSGLSVFA